MNSGQKTAVSLLLTIVLFAAFVFTAFAGVFSKIETRFYTPARISHERTELQIAADFCNTYIDNLLSKIQTDFVQDESVRSYLSQTPNESDVIRRVQVTGKLTGELPCIREIRLIDKNGRNVHFSTRNSDIYRQTGTSKIYKNYPDIVKNSDELSFEAINLSESEEYKLTFNSKMHQLCVSIPLKDQYNIFRGIFVFYINPSEIEKELIRNNITSVGDSLILLANGNAAAGGFVINMPRIGQNLFTESILKAWKSTSTGPDKIISDNDNEYWVLLSDYSSKYIYFGRIYDDKYFELPKETRILLCICVFITLFLFLFLILNLKHDEMVVIRSRVKKLQFAMINEYLENKDEVDWEKVSRQIEYRKNDLFEDIRKSLGHKGKKHKKELDLLLENSWNEILSAVGTKRAQTKIGTGDTEEIRKLLESAISSGSLKVETVNAAPVLAEVLETRKNSELADQEDEIEEIEEAESVEELSEVEPVEEAESLEDAEILEEVETLDEAEPVEEVEALEDAESVEEVEDLSDAELLEDVEEIEEAESVEELSEVEPVEEAESLEDAEILEEVETLDEAEPVEEVEALEDAESVEEVEDLSDAELLEDVEEIEEAESVEEISEDSGEVISETADNLEHVELSHFVENVKVFEKQPDVDDNVIIPKVAVDNNTFAPLTDNTFATVDTVFAEELQFGIPYTHYVDADHREEEIEETMEFDLLDPDFGIDEELIPVEEAENYSMTGFAQDNVEVTELSGENENTIVEVDGVFSIAENLVIPRIEIDADFKKLVDSVLK